MSHRKKEEHGRKLRRRKRRRCERQTLMERLGFQMTHVKWKCLQKKKN
jgi:hypothetical protein